MTPVKGLTDDERVLLNAANTEIELRDARIRQLEQLLATLAGEVDAQRPVVEAAMAIATRLRDLRSPVDDEEQLVNAVAAYEARKAK